MKQRTWKRAGLICLSVVMILSLYGCHSYEDGDHYGANHHYSLGAIELNNYSDVTIDHFYMTPSDQSSWGSDILSESLYSVETVIVEDIEPDNYDAMITVSDQYSDYFCYLYDISISPHDIYTWDVYNSSFTGSLELHNISDADILEVYVVPADDSTWGDNQTTSDIRPAGRLHVNDLERGLYDVMVVWDVGPESIYYGIMINSLTLTELDVE